MAVTWVSNAVAVLGLLVAGWAAWTAHEARRWQRRRDEDQREREAERVATRVELRATYERRLSEDVSVAERGLSEHDRAVRALASAGHVVRVWVTNHGALTEYVTELSVVTKLPAPKSEHRWNAGSYELAPRASVETSFNLSDAEFEDLQVRPGYVAATLGSGLFISRKLLLDKGALFRDVRSPQEEHERQP